MVITSQSTNIESLCYIPETNTVCQTCQKQKKLKSYPIIAFPVFIFIFKFALQYNPLTNEYFINSDI